MTYCIGIKAKNGLVFASDSRTNAGLDNVNIYSKMFTYDVGDRTIIIVTSGNLETIVGAMFAGKTSELLKRILWAKHQNKKIIVIKPSIDNRYSSQKIITHNDLSHECFAMINWKETLEHFSFKKDNTDVVFLDEIQFMDTNETLSNIEKILNEGIDVVCAGLDQDSRGRPWETSSMVLGLSDKILKIYGFCNVCGMEATKTYRKTEGGDRTQVGAANIYEPRCLKHWEPR